MPPVYSTEPAVGIKITQPEKREPARSLAGTAATGKERTGRYNDEPVDELPVQRGTTTSVQSHTYQYQKEQQKTAITKYMAPEEKIYGENLKSNYT